MAQTIRQPSFTSLLIDSMDRYPDGYPSGTSVVTSSSKWTLQNKNYVLNGYFTRLALTSVQMFWTLPTIITGYNDQIELTKYSASPPYGPVATYVATIPQGWYNPASLAGAIFTQLNAVVGNIFTTTTTKPLGNITIIGSAAFSLDAANTSNSRAGRFYQTSGLIPTGPLGSNTVVTTTGGPPTLLPTRYIDITSSYLTKFQRVKDASTLPTGSTQNILGRVYAFAGNTSAIWPPSTQTQGGPPTYTTTYTFTTPTPFVVSQDFTTPKQIAWDPEEVVSNFDITLLDEYGTEIPWDPSFGLEYQISMLASET